MQMHVHFVKYLLKEIQVQIKETEKYDWDKEQKNRDDEHLSDRKNRQKNREGFFYKLLLPRIIIFVTNFNYLLQRNCKIFLYLGFEMLA